jgi:hypothetical protein
MAMDLKFLEFNRFRSVQAAPAAPQVFDGLAQVRAYWEGLRREGNVPARQSLDPRGLNGVLDRVFIAERIGKGLLQVRIAGSGLVDFAGSDLRGLPLSCLFANETRPVLAEALEEVCTAPAEAEIDLASDRGNGKAVARLILLPLADEDDRKLVLGAISFAAKPERCKFQVLRRKVTRLYPAAPVPGPTLSVVPASAPHKAHGHLRLVHSRN